MDNSAPSSLGSSGQATSPNSPQNSGQAGQATNPTPPPAGTTTPTVPIGAPTSPPAGTQPATPKPQRKLPAALIGILVFLITSAAIAFFYKDQIMKMVSKPTTLPTPQKVVAPSPSPTPTVFTKRGYKLSDFILGDKTFPDELKNISEQQLIGFNCSPIKGNNLSEISHTKISQADILNDQILEQIMKSQNGTKDFENIHAIRYCNLEDGRIMVVIYKIPVDWRTNFKSNWVENFTANFGFLNNGKFNSLVKYNPGNSVAGPMTWFTPLQFDKNNKFYYLINDGDVTNQRIIHKIDFNAKTHQIIITCRDSYSDDSVETFVNEVFCN